MHSRTHSADGQDSVSAQISYLVPMKDKPTTYVCDPPAGKPALNATYEWQPAVVRNARPLRARLSLEHEGFLLADHTSATSNFWDDSLVRSVYFPEVEELVRSLTGAREALVFDHTRRRRTGRGPLNGNQLTFSDVREPVGKAHADFTARSAVARLKLEVGARAAELQAGRFAIINVWRPLNRAPILDAPLAVLDAGSMHAEDLVASDLIYSDRIGETYNLTYSPTHRWHYFPEQNRNEAIVFKNFDSQSTAPFAPHTAFDDPHAPPDAPLRESIEARVFAFF
ncbi:methyltransferase [Variovorax sp. WS11]|uniref:CmcJ/NvfI family oxidoreductase n=1 Tax=Variovorax sp. WS11 TaxID=1105204 RepID=UPI000D0D88AE|nr:CmcJ/NvfI family oxidoreductase [Variovorax sp. WS11]NDZ17656.1 methyltransferase [Variovorax sp. WS11]PSL79564.1 methyltransferase [Variovorax sp. WS11]